MRTASPTAPWIADPDTTDRQTNARSDLAAFARHQVERLRLQPALDTAPDAVGGTAKVNMTGVEPDSAWRRRFPVNLPINPEQGNRDAGPDLDRCGSLSDLLDQPVLLLARPAQCLCSTAPPRQRQPQFGARGIEHQTVSPRTRMMDEPHRPMRIADEDMRPFGSGQIRRCVRQDDFPAARQAVR